MKQSVFISLLTLFSFIAALAIFFFVFGDPANFKDEAKEVPINTLGQIYTGGVMVSFLVTLSIMVIAIIIERIISHKRAKGKGSPEAMIHKVIESLKKDEVDEAITICEAQKGAVSNILSSALKRYKEIDDQPKFSDGEKKVAEVQRAVEEASMLETPLLEKNLIALSTIASIATMIGLLGTTLGMIRAFKALAQAGAPDAIALATGISEALINTAGGLFVAILGIISYNVFINNVDNFSYQVDEASYNIMQIIKGKQS
ncbi:MAG: MotA/TolQ/ExbB proton channel family protein [Ignavibacteriales bacterium]|nr:hypothetical protein [Ignavibacteriaceae bacterium]MCK6615545.1 MotA/TolQ/ExbB proton channel family protein [Ignavibacteriaceae bacterium]QOJ29000.1 MAG: MotA/TolQ/ExbB proton channel family protein [Ignavibacteriales bacterium]